MKKLIKILQVGTSNEYYHNLLATIETREFCERLNELRAIEANNTTRTKKRAIGRILESLDKLDKLGFKITIEPK